MRRFRNVFLGLVLACAAISGGPVPIEEVEELMQAVSQPKIAHTLPDENPDGEPAEDFRRFCG
jgi:hypothetical protein